MQATTDAPTDEGASTLIDLAGAAAALRDIGPDLHAALLETIRRIDALARAGDAQRAELAALGAKVNALLDRPEPAAIDLADQLARQDERLARLHDLVERLHAVAVAERPPPPLADDAVRRDVSLLLDVVAGLADRIERLDARLSASAGPLADLEASLSSRAEHVERQLAELAAVVSRHDGADVAALRQAVAEELEARPQGEPAPVDPQPIVDAMRTQLAGVRVTLESDDLAGQVAGRTEVALAGLLRLVDQRLERLRADVAPPAGGDALDDLVEAVHGVGDSLAGVAARQEELAALLAGHVGDAPASEGLGRQLDDLGQQLQAVAARIDATLAELERRQPLVTADQLKRAAASVRDAVAGTRRARS